VQGIRDHRAEDGDHDHRQPVPPGEVAANGQLEDHGRGESDGPEANSDVCVDLMHRVVRRRLAYGGRQDIEYPEVRCDLRDLPQRPACGAHRAEGAITWINTSRWLGRYLHWYLLALRHTRRRSRQRPDLPHGGAAPRP
jgi:hypothetical protein